MLNSLTKLPPDSLMGASVRFPLKFIPSSHVTVVRRGINKGFRWIVGSSIHGCWLGTYEQEKQILISRLVRPGMVVWDVGANAGFYTLAFSRLVGSDGRVYAFEPSAENVSNLLRHLTLNSIRNVQVIQAAMGEETGLIGFSVGASNLMGRTSRREKSYLVPTLSVDNFLTRFPEARPDLIKIDIEGDESSFLKGASQLLQHFAPKIVLALHGGTQTRRCAEFLHSHEYLLFYLDGSAADSVPLKSDEIYAQK